MLIFSVSTHIFQLASSLITCTYPHICPDTATGRLQILLVFLFYYLITLVRTMILSKSFAIACSLALLKVSAAEETISLSAGFMEATNLAQRGENEMWEGFLFDLADVLVDKAAADGVTLSPPV